MEITQPELILTHSLWLNAPSQVELFSVLFFKRVGLRHIASWVVQKSLNLFQKTMCSRSLRDAFSRRFFYHKNFLPYWWRNFDLYTLNIETTQESSEWCLKNETRSHEIRPKFKVVLIIFVGFWGITNSY